MTAPAPARQPFLNQRVVLLAAPTQLWCAPDGDLGDSPIDGVYFADWRLISQGRLRIAGEPLEAAGSSVDTDTLRSWGLARGLDDRTPDPRVVVERTHTVADGRVTQQLRLRNGLADALDFPVLLEHEVGFAQLQTIKAGTPVQHEVELSLTGDGVLATDGTRTLRITADQGEFRLDGPRIRLHACPRVASGATTTLTMTLEFSDRSAVVTAGSTGIAELPPTGNPSLDRWARRAVADCRALLLDAGQGAFVAAGAPWFLTLFGRDSLTAARLLLPLAPDLARTTLRTLAVRQGRQHHPQTEEQPGRILHELRSEPLELPGEGVRLPPVYYGTIDATGLWVILLHDAWRAGLTPAEVAEFRPALEAALGWLRDHACPDDSGFLKYIDATGHGLANQGWKDSGDSIRFHDGRIAEGPIALAEVQAQAVLAAENGAALLELLGADGAPWRAWAAGLRARFREAFWVERDGVRFPAIALDGSGRAVDSMTSNMGQLIGTTLLDAAEERAVADLLLAPGLLSGFGVRTMASDEGGYWPLSYHCGSVWTHDTAVVIEGMLRAGLDRHARVLAEQLVAAADSFDSRMPELFAGFSRDEAPTPVAYPASCRIQGWAAAAVVPVHRALSGS